MRDWTWEWGEISALHSCVSFIIWHSYYMRKNVHLPAEVGTFVNDVFNTGTILFMLISYFTGKKKEISANLYKLN